MSIYKCKIDVYDMYEADYLDGECNIFKNKYHIKMAIEEYFEKYIEPVVHVIIKDISGSPPYKIREGTIHHRCDINKIINKII